MSKSSRVFVCLVALLATLSTLTFAVTPDRISGNLATGRVVVLRGNVHHKALPQFDRGLADPSLRLGSMKLLLSPTPSQIKALQALLVQQQDPKSPNYHKWLTPQQWADRFGVSPNDIAKITAWLKSQGFTVGAVANGRNWITFSGTAAQVQAAFGAPIHRYEVNGEMHLANASAPQIPSSLVGIVSGIHGMNDFRPKPRAVHRNFVARPRYNSSNFGDLIAPGDIATIYDINSLYGGSIDGTGQKLAIVGQTDIFLSDIVDFRTGFGLSSITCTTTTTGTVGVISACSDPHLKYVFVNDSTTVDPLVPLSGDLSEADLDLEWSGAVARGAQLIFVNAPFVQTSGGFTGGVWDAWYWAVDNKLAPVISMSYGLCEFFDNYVLDPTSGAPLADELELMKANSFGITFVNSSGDFGAAECDSNSTLSIDGLATQGIAVGYPASSPEVTGVGGTAIPYQHVLPNLSGSDTSTYWGTTNGTDGGTLLSSPQIPEQAWNDDDEIGLLCAQNSLSFCTGNGISDALSAQNIIGVSSAGGGVSNCAVQDVTNTLCVAGFPQPSWQSVSISGQSGARFSPDVSLLATPNFPGYIFCTQLAELNVSGSGSSCAGGIAASLNLTDTSGNLTGSIIGGTSASAPVFAGIVTLMNQKLNGASATGLGNINPTLYALASDSSNGAFHPITLSSNQVYCVPNTPAPLAQPLLCPASGLLGFLGSNTDATTSFNLATGLGSVDAANLATAWHTLVNNPSFTLSPGTTSFTAAIGSASNSTTITISAAGGFTGTVDFSCSNLPAGATCNFTPTSSTTGTSLSVQTASSMSNLQNASFTVTGTSGTTTSSIAVNLTTTGGSQSFTLQSSAGGGTISIVPGQTAVIALAVHSTDGFVTNVGGVSSTAVAVSYTCSGLPSEATCNFSPSSSTQVPTLTLNISTTAPTAKLQRPLDRGNRIFYAMLLPGLMGIVFTFSSRKRTMRGVRFLSLMLVLGCSTIWMASCGGSSGSGGGSHNAGTPPGNYSVTVTGTPSGGSVAAQSTTFTLAVQ